MDIGLYTEEVDCSFGTTPFSEQYLCNMTSLDGFGQGFYYDKIEYMRQPPTQIFEWHEADNCTKDNALSETAVNTNVKTEPVEVSTDIDTNSNSRPILSIEDPIGKEYPEVDDLLNNPDVVHGFNLFNVKQEITDLATDIPPNNRPRLKSESSDILNTSFSSVDLKHFDLTEYVLADKEESVECSVQSSQTESAVTGKTIPKVKTEQFEKPNVTPKFRAGCKKIDMKARKYIVDDECSDDEMDVDIETVSEEESAPVLEAGDISSLLDKFEAHIECKAMASVDVKVEIKVEPLRMPVEKNYLKTEVPVDICYIKKEFVAKVEPGGTCSTFAIKKEVETDVELINICNIKKEVITEEPDVKTKPRKACKKDKEKHWSKKSKLVKSSEEQLPVKLETISMIPKGINPIKSQGKPKDGVVDQGKKIKSQDSSKPKEVVMPQENIKHETISRMPKGVIKLQEITQPKHVVMPQQNIKLGGILSTPKGIITPHEIIKQKEVVPQETLQLKLENGKLKESPNFKGHHNQIMKSLPQDLINKIKQSSKRKPVPIIEPIPNKRMKTSKTIETQTMQPARPNPVHLDHNYCSNSSSNIPPSKKDSGFVSSEEDDKSILSRQPTVKNADGTLMVSLLKSNTIHDVEPAAKNKRKLNLDEYKKLRKDVVRSQDSSNNKPTRDSQLNSVQEDDQQKMVKHQEKLRNMAKALLNAAPRAEKKISSPTTANNSTGSSTSASPCSDASKQSPPVYRQRRLSVDRLPPNLERKILVSIGVNTEFNAGQGKDALLPVERLQEIQPLLEKASDRINHNSLISSVIENIPKVLESKVRIQNSPKKFETDVHGENKSVLYLEKNRVRPPVRDAETQTTVSLQKADKNRVDKVERIDRVDRKPRGYYSNGSSYANRDSRRMRNESYSSTSSSTGTSPNSSQSPPSRFHRHYSRSKSTSPGYRTQKRKHVNAADHKSAVEERRIIYVGCITESTTREDLRQKFQKFGPINNISLHFRDIGENYGFVTFKYKDDAHAAYEHGNDDRSFPAYKISFGGRREFCKAAYSDLDNMRDDTRHQSRSSDQSFSTLLKDFQRAQGRKVY